MARRYRKIDPRMWKDEGIRALPPDGKLIAVYCITAQSNRIGIFNFSLALAAEDLGLISETFPEGFRKVCERLSWEWDEGARVLYLPSWWKYNLPENPNVLKSCLPDLEDLPKTPLVQRFSSNETYIPETFRQTFREGCGEPTPKPPPNQEQEQEQEQEEGGGKPPAPSVAPREIHEAWNGHPGFVRCRQMTDKRVTALRARAASPDWRDNWRAALDRAAASPFLTGTNDRGWRMDVEFFLRPDTVTKILEGKYDGRHTANGHAPRVTEEEYNAQLAAERQAEEEAKAKARARGPVSIRTIPAGAGGEAV